MQVTEDEAADAGGKQPSKTVPASLVWGGSALLAGAVFCGAAGIFEDILDRNKADDAVKARMEHDAYASIETGSLPSIYVVSSANCTALELDRNTNQTTARSCPAEGLSLRIEPGRNRADLVSLASPRDQ